MTIASSTDSTTTAPNTQMVSNMMTSNNQVTINPTLNGSCTKISKEATTTTAASNCEEGTSQAKQVDISIDLEKNILKNNKQNMEMFSTSEGIPHFFNNNYYNRNEGHEVEVDNFEIEESVDPPVIFHSLRLVKPAPPVKSKLHSFTMKSRGRSKSASYVEDKLDSHATNSTGEQKLKGILKHSPRQTTEFIPTFSCGDPAPLEHTVSLGSYGSSTACEQAVKDVNKLIDCVGSDLVVATSPTNERTITSEEFNAARDAFCEASRAFVGDCRHLATSAAFTRSALVTSIKTTMKTFAAIVARCRRMNECLSAPSDKSALFSKLRDLADAFRLTLCAAWRGVGNHLDETSGGGELKSTVCGLTGALRRLIQTLLKLDYKCLVRRF